MESKEQSRLLQFVPPVILLLLLTFIFLRYLYPVYIGMDTDIFWHIKTGEVIVHDGQIPSNDPFTYTPKDREREQVLLTSYWLADVLLYSIYKISGFTGIAVVRSLILCLTVFIVYLAVRKRGFFISVLLSLLLSLVFMPFSAIRPNLFSFLFTAIIIFFMERYREEPKRIYQIIIVMAMLFWANMHGGYTVGVGILGLYIAGEILPQLIKGRKSQNAKRCFPICLTASSGIVATIINPLGIKTLLFAINQLTFPAKTLQSHIEADMGFFKNIKQHPNEIVFLSLFLVGIILIYTSLNLTRRKAGLTETSIVLVLLLLSIFSVRVMPIFIIAGLIISAGKGGYHIFSIRRNKWFETGALSFILVLLFFFIWISFPKVHPGKLVETDVVYPKLGEFLERNHIKGNMLNREFTGNYFIFRLYPNYRVFTDSRYLNIDVFSDGLDMFYAVEEQSEQKDVAYVKSLIETCIHGLRGKARKDYDSEYWNRLLEKYDIDFIVGRMSQPGSGQLFPLFLKLIHNDTWKLIYMDGNAVIMVKDNNKNDEILRKFPPRDKRLLYDEAILENVHNNSPSAYETLSYAFLMRGDKTNAELFAKNALYLDKNLKIARVCLEQAKIDTDN